MFQGPNVRADLCSEAAPRRMSSHPGRPMSPGCFFLMDADVEAAPASARHGRGFGTAIRLVRRVPHLTRPLLPQRGRRAELRPRRESPFRPWGRQPGRRGECGPCRESPLRPHWGRRGRVRWG
jgi:hypothetical protein